MTKCRNDLFEDVKQGERPAWILVGTPPGSVMAKHAGYDPETYEILCQPGGEIESDQVKRLWDLELLRSVI